MSLPTLLPAAYIVYKKQMPLVLEKVFFPSGYIVSFSLGKKALKMFLSVSRESTSNFTNSWL